MSVMGCAVIVMAGCNGCGWGSCSSDPECRNLMATLPAAMKTGSADQLATIIQQEMAASTQVPEAERADLLARAQVLKAHARSLGAAIDLYDPAGKKNPSITLANLNARAEALDIEYQTAFREWGIWQVRHGVKKPEEVFQVFDYERADDWGK